MHSTKTLHVTWDSLRVHLAEREQRKAQLLAGWQPKPWRVPTEEEMAEANEAIDWCATP